MEQAELADRLGFHAYWIAEIHCQPKFSLLSAPYVVLGSLAQRTKRLRLGVAVNTLPVHHPVQLAEQAAMLDLVSHGRMEFAAGGGHPHSRAYECFGADHQTTHELMAESLDIIRKAWCEPKLTHQGKFFRIPEVMVNPKPVQKPLPPFYMATSSLDVTITLAAAQNTDGATSSFSITGGGATFQLSPTVDLTGKASIGIAAVTTGRLGSAVNGRLSALASGGTANVVTGDVGSGQRIVDDAISSVSKLRGRLGSFQTNTVGATIRSLGVALENTSAAESQIRDTDFAAETANLTRNQILVQAATSILSIANAQPQNVLALLQ